MPILPYAIVIVVVVIVITVVSLLVSLALSLANASSLPKSFVSPMPNATIFTWFPCTTNIHHDNSEFLLATRRIYGQISLLLASLSCSIVACRVSATKRAATDTNIYVNLYRYINMYYAYI